MQAAERSADERVGSERLARGNEGEKLAADWLAANKYEILDYKPDIKGTNQGGIDMVAMKDNKVYLVDNKALSRDGNVSSVSALTTHFKQNLEAVKQSLRAMADDAERSAKQRAVVQKAIEALEKDNYVKVVTNANVTSNDRILGGVTEKLKADRIRFVDVMNKERDDRNRAASEWLDRNGYDLVHSKAEERINQPGIDMVAMKDDVAYLLDNNAVTRNGRAQLRFAADAELRAEPREGEGLAARSGERLDEFRRGPEACARGPRRARGGQVRPRGDERERRPRPARPAGRPGATRARGRNKEQQLILLDVIAAEQDAKKKAVTEEAEKEEEV